MVHNQEKYIQAAQKNALKGKAGEKKKATLGSSGSHNSFEESDSDDLSVAKSNNGKKTSEKQNQEKVRQKLSRGKREGKERPYR